MKPTRASKAASRTDDTVNLPVADRLLSTSAKLFREKGYAASTTRELSQLFDIQKASLYHYIDSKEDLLFEICTQSLGRITEEVSRASDEAPEPERLKAMIEAHLECALADRDLHATMLIDMAALSDERKEMVVKLRDNHQRLLNDAIVADQAAGRARDDIDSRLLTLALLNLLNWTIFWFDPEGDMSATELRDVLTDVYLNGAKGRADEDATAKENRDES